MDDDEFWDSGTEVDSWETGAYQADEDMKKIWVEDGVTMTYDEYMDELEEQDAIEEEMDKKQLKLNFD